MTVRIFKDQRSPSLTDTIKIDGVAFDLAGSTVKLRMRAENSAVLKIDTAATPVVAATTTAGGDQILPYGVITVASTTGFLSEGSLNVAGQDVTYTAITPTTFTGCKGGTGTITNGAAVAQKGGVRYDWAAVDVDTPGDWLGWWRVTLPSALTQDTLEFPVEILEHADQTASLCTLADVREQLKMDANIRGDDPRIEVFIEVASQQIMKEYRREFAPATEASLRILTLRPNVLDAVFFDPYDLRAATLVRLNPEEASPTTLVADTDYMLLPFGGDQDGVYTHMQLSGVGFGSAINGSFGFSQIEITGDWGYETVPHPVRQACALTVISWLRRDVSGFATILADDIQSSAPDLPSNYSIPPAARRLLNPYRRKRLIY